jgi:tRNA threonylcarbamoyladenosine biosynthesis protein TsaB
LLDGEATYERRAADVRAQSALVLPMIDAVLADSGLRLRALDALVVGRGPGSFTGVRLAIGVAQGLAYGAGLPIIPVSDLAMLAQGALGDAGAARVLACLDARMGEVYWCTFRRGPDGLASPLHEERLSTPSQVEFGGPDAVVGVGPGWASDPMLRARLGPALAACEPARLPHARDALALATPLWRAGAALAPEQVLPVYLRERVATPRR